MTSPEHHDESGFTLIEVVIAAAIIVLAFAALATVFIDGQAQGSAAVQESQLINGADQQIETIRSAVAIKGFDALGTATLATFATKTPAAFVTGSTSAAGGCYEIASNYDGINTSVTTAPTVVTPSSFVPWSECTNGEPQQVVGTGAIISGSGTACTNVAPIPSPCTLTIGSLTVTVYTFVTDTYVGCAATTTSTSPCPSTITGNQVTNCPDASTTATSTFGTSTSTSVACADARRVTVAVVPSLKNHSLQRLTPVYVSSLFTNPQPSTSSSSSVGLTLGLGV